jgi:endonuclease YncB( thermonuclease family)
MRVPMKHFFHFVAALAGLLTCSIAEAQAVVLGLGRAKDGDTLLVGETEVRLFGIDAPEFDQTCSRQGHQWNCGAVAADALTELVTGKEVQCLSTASDQYGRVLGRCSVGRTDINQTMVEMGYAIAYRRYSSDYAHAEETAKAGKLGVWVGTFEVPERFRKTGGYSAAAKTRSSRKAARPASNVWAGGARLNCNIKGNRNRKGQWIYHLPGMPYYEQTRPEEIFCTEAEAQTAGYRRAVVK